MIPYHKYYIDYYNWEMYLLEMHYKYPVFPDVWLFVLQINSLECLR